MAPLLQAADDCYKNTTMAGIEQIEKKVKNPELCKVIALSSDERALIDEALQLLRGAFLSPSSAELNHHKFSSDSALDEVMSTLFSMPFLGTHRVVELHDAEKLPASLVVSLCDYISTPCPSTLLIVVFGKIDKRNKFAAALEAFGMLCALGVDGAQDRKQFLYDHAEKAGVVFTKDAVDLLLSLTDGDLLLLKNAVRKFALLEVEITAEHVENHISETGAPDVFVLARLISEGRLTDALVALGRLRNNQENAIKFLGVLMWQMRVLVHLRCCLDEGQSDWDIRKRIGVFGDRFVWMSQIAKKRNLQFHVERLTRLAECDRALKTGAVDEPYHVLEKLVYQSAVGL